jgi:UDP-glucose 4-epimerase
MTSLESEVFVTGGCGFVGARLCADLVREGRRVVALDNLSLGTPGNWAADAAAEIELVNVDVRDQSALQRLFATRRPAVVYHLAAIHFIPACDADPAGAISVNVTGTQALLSALAAARSEATAVLASTGAVYAPSDRPLPEEAELAPTDIYGLTKLWMEQAAELHHRRHRAAIGIARLFNVIGEGETNPHLLPEIIVQARRGTTLRLGNLTTRRDYVYVGDVSKGLMSLARSAPEHGYAVCNLGAEQAIDGHALVAAVAGELGRELVVETDAARVRQSDRPVLASDCACARTGLGWSAGTSLEESVRAAVDDPRWLAVSAGKRAA